MSPWVLLSDKTVENVKNFKDFVEAYHVHKLETSRAIELIIEDWISLTMEFEERMSGHVPFKIAKNLNHCKKVIFEYFDEYLDSFEDITDGLVRIVDRIALEEDSKCKK